MTDTTDMTATAVDGTTETAERRNGAVTAGKTSGRTARADTGRPSHLMTALRDTPVGIGPSRPRLWWEDPVLGGLGCQQAYEIRLTDGTGAGRSTGWVVSDRSTAVPWPFDPLPPLGSCSWQVRVRMTDPSTGAVRQSDWSAPQRVVRGPESAGLWEKALPIWSPSGTPVTARHPGPVHSPDGTLTLSLPLPCPAVTLLGRGADDGNDGYAWTIDPSAGTLTAQRKMNGVLTTLASARLPEYSGDTGHEATDRTRAADRTKTTESLTVSVHCDGGSARTSIDGTEVLRQDGIEDAGGAWGVQAGRQDARIASVRLEDAAGRTIVRVDPADGSRPLPWFSRRDDGMMVVPAGSAGMLGEPLAGDYWALLRRTVDLPQGRISSALVFTTAADPLGARQYVYRLLVNGAQAGTGPSRGTDGPVYETHDVTGLLHPGRNTIAALCWAQAGGWFRALLHVTYDDGRTLTLGTDGSWLARSGGRWRPWDGDLNNGVHYYVAPREDIDARQEPVGWDVDPDWDDATARRAGFRPARVATDAVTGLPSPAADTSAPLVRLTRKPASVRRIGPARWLVDAGIESAYAVDLAIGTPQAEDTPLPDLSGVRLRLRMGEQLLDAARGEVRFETLSCMRFEDMWTLRDAPQRLCHWGYRGFRWLQVDALPPAGTGNTASDALPSPEAPARTEEAGTEDEDDSRAAAGIPAAVLDTLDAALRTDLRLCTDLVPEPDQTGSFASSDADLDDVWNLCATSIREGRQDLFMDTPVRERMPYEGDALTHGRCEMALARSYDITRKTWRYLARRPGKFTEYRFMMAPLAWEEYLETGDADALRADWRLLWDEQAFRYLDSDGLVTKDPKMPGCTDIVDWPQPGELDGFVFTPTNTVVNVWALQGFDHLALIAGALGLAGREKQARDAAARLRARLRQEMPDPSDGAWKDGVGTDHTALHSALYALSLGAATADQNRAGGRWLVSRHLEEGLPVSPNAATWLLEALFASGQGRTGLAVMASHSRTSWWSMRHREGATQTMEGWSPRTKWNTTFAHPWAAGPLWVIARRVLGVRVDKPGAAHVTIAPQTGGLREVRGSVATVRGIVRVEITPDKVRITVPANMRAVLRLDGREHALRAGVNVIARR